MSKGYSSKGRNCIMQTTPSYFREKYNQTFINQVDILSPSFCKDIINRTPQVAMYKAREPQTYLDYLNMDHHRSPKQIRSNSRHEEPSLNQYKWKSTIALDYQTNNYSRMDRIDPMVYPKNQEKCKINQNENQSTIKVINETEVVIIQSLWRGILVRKQVAQQLTIYYRNRDLVSLTLRLIMVNISDVFDMIKNRPPKKKVMLIKKTNCFKSNITQASSLYQRNKESNTIIDSNANTTIISTQCNGDFENPKLQKKKVILKTKQKEKDYDNLENESKTNERRNKNLKSITPHNNQIILKNDMIQSKEDIAVKAGYSKIKEKPLDNLQMTSFMITIIQSEIKPQLKLNSNYQEEKVNILNIIQSKFHQFDLNDFCKDKNSDLCYMPSNIVKLVERKKIDKLLIDTFSESFFSIKKTQCSIFPNINYSEVSVMSYSYLPTQIKIPSLKTLPHKTETQKIDSKASLSNRSLLSRRFNKFIQDDLLDYSSNRNHHQTEQKFSFQSIMVVNELETFNTGFELICKNEICDDLIIPKKAYAIELQDSIFTHNFKKKSHKYRSINSFDLTISNKETFKTIKRSSLFKTLINSSIQIVSSLSFSINLNEDENNIISSKSIAGRIEMTDMKLLNNKEQLPQLLYTIITKEIIIFVSSILYEKIMQKPGIMKTLISHKETQYAKIFLKHWKNKVICSMFFEEIKEKKKLAMQICTNEITIEIEASVSKPSIRKKSLDLFNKEEKEIISHSERTKNISSFRALTANPDCSFQLLNIKTHIIHHHYSHRNKAATIKPFTIGNESFLSSYRYNSLQASPIGKKLNRRGDISLRIQYSRQSKLWLLIPKLYYQSIKILVKHFIKWKMVSSSLCTKKHHHIYELKHLIKIRSNNYLKMIIRFLYKSIWAKWEISKTQKKSFQIITFRNIGLSLKDQRILEGFNKIAHIITRHWLYRLIKHQINVFSEQSISSQNMSFSSSNNCFSPGPSNRIMNVLICDNEGEDKVLRVKHVRHKNKKDSLKTSYSQELTTKQYGKQMKIRFVTKRGLIKMPPRPTIPVNTNIITTEKLQLKKFLQEIKTKSRIKKIIFDKGFSFIKIVINYYIKYCIEKKQINYFNKWVIISKYLNFLKKRSILQKCLVHINISKNFYYIFQKWKKIANQAERNIVLSNQQRYLSRYLSLHISFTQWKYINNAQVVNKKHILNGLSRLSLFFNSHYKMLLVFVLKYNK